VSQYSFIYNLFSDKLSSSENAALDDMMGKWKMNWKDAEGSGGVHQICV
jgi:hypothetical protein